MPTVTYKMGIRYVHGEQTKAQLAKIKKSDIELWKILTKK